MAKKDMSAELLRIEQLEAENAALRAEQHQPKSLRSVEDEFKVIDKKGNNTAGGMRVKEFTDHKNISLWMKDGQRIGPLHPDNAKKALIMFKERGIILSATQPTVAEVEAYQKTDEFLELQKVAVKKRAIKELSRKSGAMDKLIATMEKTYGLDKAQLSNVLSPEQVKGR